MDLLVETYTKLKKLRESGVKMKDIANVTDMTSSVLSSLYSTVLPSYIESLSAGMGEDEALDKALTMVNNISKKYLLNSITLFHARLSEMKHGTTGDLTTSCNFFSDIEHEAARYINNVPNYSGLYLAYSRLSHKDAMKEEPFLIMTPESGELMPKVCFASETGHRHWGNGLFSAHQIGYMFFNEQKSLQLSLKTISLQLPPLEFPGIIKGIYLAHDYNRNPIARRIVFVKIKNEVSPEEFNDYQFRIIEKGEMTEQERYYYEYTCMEGDYVRSIMAYSPKNDLEDLKREKAILSII